MKLTKSKLKQLIKEELALMAGLEIEHNFIKKHGLAEHDEDTSTAGEKLVRTWTPKYNRITGKAHWEKENHGDGLKAFVETDGLEWTWETWRRDEDGGLTIPVNKGTATSYKQVMIDADEALSKHTAGPTWDS
jgi:hypothetical protein